MSTGPTPHKPQLLGLDEAIERILACVAAPGAGSSETVSTFAARGRFLAEDVRSQIDVPPADNSAMDGYALRAADVARPGTVLPVSQRIVAGSIGAPLATGTAARIFTGAQIPAGADAVVMQEQCTALDGSVRVDATVAAGDSIRRRGEDVERGARVLAAGLRLTPQAVGMAASVGAATLRVARQPRVALFSTGDELREPGNALSLGAIYDANRYTLRALLLGLGAQVSDLGILADKPEVVRAALGAAANTHDLVLTSGGMSTGEEDHVKAAVEALGKLHFWRLAIKPGRPVAMGQIGRVPFIGLPGNPVAVMVTFLLLARPLMLLLAGANDPGPKLYRVRAGFDYKKRPNRTEYVRARLVRDSEGNWIAEKFARDGAGILTSMVESDGLAEIAEGVTKLEPGMTVDFLPFSEVIP
jgi:molybdopterin molybdotransferase